MNELEKLEQARRELEEQANHLRRAIIISLILIVLFGGLLIALICMAKG